MTLVIAKVHSGGVNLIADWRLTRDQRRTLETPNFLNGTLKAWIVHPALCIAYASDDYLMAERAIRLLGIRPHGHVELRRILEALQCASVTKSEFLVAARADGPALWQINGGNAYARNIAWIGDYRAHEKYLEFLPSSIGFTDPTAFAFSAEFSRMETAFDRLLSDGGVSTVGEIGIAVVSTPSGFVYQTRRYLWSPPLVHGEGTQVPFHFGTPEQGAFALVVIPAENEPAVGIYFPHGRFGALFFPGQERLTQPVKFHNVTEEEFCVRVGTDCGVVLLPRATRP